VIGYNLAQVKAFQNEGRGREIGYGVQDDEEIRRKARHWDEFLMEKLGLKR